MGAAEQQKFSQYPYQYGDGLRGAALAQTRNGKDELITPIAFWELDAATGLYLPPGMSSNPRKPRVEATLTGRQVDVLTVFDAEEIRDTKPRDKTVNVSSYRLIRAVAISTLNTSVSIELRSPSESNVIRVWDGDGWVPLSVASIDASGNPRSYLLNTFFPELNQPGWPTIHFRVTPSAAPSTGSFTLQIWGVPL